MHHPQRHSIITQIEPGKSPHELLRVFRLVATEHRPEWRAEVGV